MGGFQHLHLIHTYERTEESYIAKELSTPLGHLYIIYLVDHIRIRSIGLKLGCKRG